MKAQACLKQARIDSAVGLTFADEEDQARISVLRDVESARFHRDEADARRPLATPPASDAPLNPHLARISMHHALPVPQQEHVLFSLLPTSPPVSPSFLLLLMVVVVVVVVMSSRARQAVAQHGY